MSKWVQHRSGQGEKWEIVKEWNDGVSVRNVKDGFIYHVPLSEYVECSPPEEWEDVSEDCQVDHAVILKPVEPDGRLSILHKVDAMRSIDIFHPGNKDNYRLIKTHGGFRVERKVK